MFDDFGGNFSGIKSSCSQASIPCIELTLSPSERKKTVHVDIFDDDVAEGDEFFVVELCTSNSFQTQLSFANNSQATVTIHDDDSKSVAALRQMLLTELYFDIFQLFRLASLKRVSLHLKMTIK